MTNSAVRNGGRPAAWLFAQAFGTTPEFCLNLQVAYDLARTRPTHTVEWIRPAS